MDARYPRSARLRRQQDFQRVVKRGDVFPGREAVVRRIANETGEARLGIATPRRFGRAVRRNRFRRLAREAFRSVRHRLGGHDYFLSPRRTLETPTLDGLREDMLRTLSRKPAPRRDGKR